MSVKCQERTRRAQFYGSLGKAIVPEALRERSFMRLLQVGWRPRSISEP